VSGVEAGLEKGVIFISSAYIHKESSEQKLAEREKEVRRDKGEGEEEEEGGGRGEERRGEERRGEESQRIAHLLPGAYCQAFKRKGQTFHKNISLNLISPNRWASFSTKMS
jgi:hypothetical protein